MSKYHFTFRRLTMFEVTETSRGHLFSRPVTRTRWEHLRFHDAECSAVASSESSALSRLEYALDAPPPGKEYRYVLVSVRPVEHD